MIKHVKLRYFSCFLAVFLTFTALTGCGNSSDTDSKNVNNTDSPNSSTQSAGNVIDGKSNFNETGYPIVNEKITLTAIVQQNPTAKPLEEMQVFQDSEKLTNISVECEKITTDIKQKLNLYFASDDLPDMIMNGFSATDLIIHGNNGQIVPLNNYIDKHMPNVTALMEKFPFIRKSITAPDGNIYSLFFVEGAARKKIKSRWFINTKWLDDLGIQVPASTDEFYEVLKAFKENDPNGNGKSDEIPFAVDNVYFGKLFGAWGVTDDYYIKDDKVVFGFMEQGYKEGLKFWNKLYREQLLDNETFTQTASQIKAKSAGSVMTLGASFNPGIMGFIAPKDLDNYSFIEPFAGPDGTKMINYRELPLDYRFVITNANKYPEESARWVDHLYNPETSMSYQRGPKEICWNYNADGVMEFAEPPEGMDYSEVLDTYAPSFYFPCVTGMDGWNPYIANESIRYEDEICENLYVPLVTYMEAPPVIFSLDDTEKLIDIKTTIETYRDEMRAKFVTGELDIDANWDTYIDTLKNMGSEKYKEIYNGGYERYNAN